MHVGRIGCPGGSVTAVLRPSRPRLAALLTALVATAVAASGSVADAVATPAVPHAVDLTFGGGDGIATVDFGGEDGCVFSADVTSAISCGIALLADGRILTASSTSGTTYDLLVSRFLADGTPDMTFGVGGSVVIDLGADEKAFDVAIDSQGRIVVVGQTVAPGGVGRSLVVRLLTDGSVDPAFGTAGVTVVQYQNETVGYAKSAVIGTDDSITIGGTTSVSTDLWFMVARLTSAGLLDAGFASGGLHAGVLNGTDITEALARRPDGTLIAAGSSYTSGASAHTFVLQPNGDLDRAWGLCGYETYFATTSSSGGPSGLVVDPTGRAVVVGFSGYGGTTRLFAQRTLANGDVDPTFGSGVVDLQIDPVPGLASATAVARSSDGRLFVAGRYRDGARFYGFVLALTDAGIPDESFAPGGLVALGPQAIDPWDIVVAADGSILVVGTAGFTATADLAVVRIAPQRAVAPAYAC